MKYLFGIVLALAAGIGAYFAVGAVLWQHEAVTAFVPVDARVTWSEVQVHASRKSTSYSPRVRYEYTYQGKAYKCERVLPFNEEGSRSWAEETVRPYHLLAQVKAYVNPRKPEEAVLVRVYSFTPYLLSMLALMGVGIGAGLTAGVIGSGRTKMTAVPMDAEGRQLLLPVRGNRQRLVDAACWFGWSVVVIGGMMAHWMMTFVLQMVHGVISLSTGRGLVLMGLAGFLALLGVVLVRRWLVVRHVSDARVMVKPAPLRRGEVFTIEVEMDAYSPLRVQEMRAKVVCTEHFKEKRGNKTQVGSRTRGEQLVVLRGPGEVAAGQVVEGKGEVFFGNAEWPPTTDLVVKAYPYYTWELVVQVGLEGMVDYEGKFPLAVE